MPTNKFKLVYDEEYDNLFIYSQAKRTTYGLEWGDLDLSFDKKGELVNLSINNASSMLSNLTNTKITASALKEISDCRLNIKKREGLLFINFKFFFRNKLKQPLEDTLTVKAPGYNSPVSAMA